MKQRKFKQSLTSVILISLIGLIIIVQVGSSIIGYHEFTVTLEAQYANTAMIIAKAGAYAVDADRLDSYLEHKERDQVYDLTEHRLQNLVDASDSLVIYVAKVDDVGGHREYIYNVVGSSSGFTPYEIGHVDDIGETFLGGYRQITDGTAEHTNFMYRKSSSIGAYTTTILPLYNKNNELTAVCGVVLPMKVLTEARRDYLVQLLIWAIILSIVSGTGWYFMMRKKLVLPLRQVADEALRFSRERKAAEVPLREQVKSHSEIGELADVVDEMEETLIQNVTELFRMTAENNRIGAELDVAAKIQANILPDISDIVPERKEIELAAYMMPAREVGGDFYDFFLIDQDHLAMVIADVSGKGIPAALFMMISKVLIKTSCMSHRDSCDPGEILTGVNQKLCENNEVDMFVTVWLGILELSSGKLVCSNAGHEYPLLGGSHGEIALYRDKHGFVLGGMEGAKEKSYTVQLEKGDTLFVYTDGVPEAINRDKEQFGTDRLLYTLNMHVDDSPAKKIQAVNEALEQFVHEEEQFDDTTMLCIRYLG